MKKSEQNLTTSLLKLIDENKGQLQLCPLCLNNEVMDRGQMIQFDSPSTRMVRVGEENAKDPEFNLGNTQNNFKSH